MSYLKMTIAMIIFASADFFLADIGLPAAVVSCVRAVVGMAFLAVILGFYKNRSGFAAFKKNWFSIILAGVALAFNWIFLLEAHQRTAGAVVTVCYYLAPVMVLLMAPLFLREKVTLLGTACTLGAYAGAVLLSGALGSEYPEIIGLMYALISAVLLCAVIIINKKITSITCLDNAFYQFVVASVVCVAYAVVTLQGVTVSVNIHTVWKLLVVSIIHTALAYSLLFSAAKRLSAQSWAQMSFLELPAAVGLGYLFYRQNLNHIEILGVALVIVFVIIGCFLRKNRR